jgi:uncharacterized membrane protein
MSETETDAPTQIEIAAPEPQLPEISAEAPLTLLDLGVVAAVVLVAAWYLYRRLWRRRGACGGCAEGNGSCAVQRANRQASAPRKAPQDQGGQSVHVPIDSLGGRRK